MYNPSIQTILSRIKEARIALGYSQSNLADHSGIKQSQISKLEAGKSMDPSLDTILKLVTSLGLSLESISKTTEQWRAELDSLTNQQAEDLSPSFDDLAAFDITEVDSHVLDKLPVIVHSREGKPVSVIKLPDNDENELMKFIHLLSTRNIPGRIIITPHQRLLVYSQGWTDDLEIIAAVQPWLIPLPGVLAAIDGLRELKPFDIDRLDFTLSSSQILPNSERIELKKYGFVFEDRKALPVYIDQLPGLVEDDQLAKVLEGTEYIATLDFYPWDSNTWIRKTRREIKALQQERLSLLQTRRISDLEEMILALEKEISSIYNCSISVSIITDGKKDPEKLSELEDKLGSEGFGFKPASGIRGYQALQILEPQNAVGGMQIHLQGIASLVQAQKRSLQTKLL